MKALLICPAERPAVSHLSENCPLAVAPLLGKCLIEYWIEALAGRGIKHLLVLASDRPNQVRAVTGDGTQWGVRIELYPCARELTVDEARAKFLTTGGAGFSPSTFSSPADGGTAENDREAGGSAAEVVLIDHLPGLPGHTLFDSYESWFAAAQEWIPHATTPTRIGAYQVKPGIWVGLHSQIAPNVQLAAPCWIGESVLVGSGAVIGPGAIIEDRAVVESGARIARSIISADTFVGRLVSVQKSLASGATVVSWESGSCLQVPDAFLLCSLAVPRFNAPNPGVFARSIALTAMIATLPVALAVMALSLLRGDSPLKVRLGVRPQKIGQRGPAPVFAYYELIGARNWLRRWPQFWSVVRGDLLWFGNRPLRPTQALALKNDFERLWLAAPVGLISLADAHGCLDELGDEACAHASFYAVNRNRRLDWHIFSRALGRALRAWPIPWPRRKASDVSLSTLVPKQEG